eukprot:COSAG01_NODE_15450_length_1336_cov_6.584479_1_plen_61_part_10
MQVGDLRQRYATNSSAMSELAASSEAAVARLATSVRDPLHSRSCWIVDCMERSFLWASPLA